MPQGSKSKYSTKQKRQAKHIEEGYEKHGMPVKEAEKRAWATVNKTYGSGVKGGSGHTRRHTKSSAGKSEKKGIEK
jgi:hypothetical protein